VHGTVTDSVLSCGVRVDEGAEVHHSVIMADVTIKRGARIDYAIVDSGTVIGEGAAVGSPAGGRESITVIPRGSRIEREREKVMG
jgi:glucose-1-phosphate adenylyltransferase